MARFMMSAALSSIMTGLAYVGIIKIKIPEEMMPPKSSWQVSMFYICAVMTMAFSLYNLVVTSFALVYAQGLALRGPPGSVAKVVRIFRAEWPSIRLVLVGSLLMLVASGIAIVWMKLDKHRFHYPLAPLGVTSVTVFVLLAMFRQIALLQSLF